MPLSIPGIELGRRLAEDAVGVLYAATGSTGPCCVRALREELAGRDDARLLFAEEARRIVSLPREHFLAVERMELAAPLPFVVTESVMDERGQAPSLEQTITGQGPLPRAEALALARRAADALAQLGARRQLHAAPIPQRLLHLPRGWVWLTFRDVRAADEAAGLKGRRHADLRYAPPEAAAEHAEPVRAGPWAAFAVGALLRSALGLGPPATDSGAPVPLPPGSPPDLLRPLLRLLEPSPRLRTPDASSALALLSGEGPPAGAPAPAPAKPLPPAPIPTRRRDRS